MTDLNNNLSLKTGKPICPCNRGYGTDIWYKGELLCKEYPYGELYSTNLYLENLIDSLTELYQEEVLNEH